MQQLREWFDALSWTWLIPLAILTSLAPWPLGPEAHLLQKLRWLTEGSLYKPLDIFDLIFHATPAILVILKGIVELVGRSGEPTDRADE